MDLNKAIKNLNRSLSKKQPLTFDHSWVKNRVRKSYNYIIENIQTESGDIDWDVVIRNLDHQHQKLWLKGVKVRKNINQYENLAEVETVLTKHKAKLYTFIVQADKDDKKICDIIIIRLVRMAQKGNLFARQKP